MEPKILMFSPSDNLDSRSPFNKDQVRLRKLLEKELQLGTTSVVLSWNGTLSKKLEIKMNPTGYITFDQTIVNDFINEVEATENMSEEDGTMTA